MTIESKVQSTKQGTLADITKTVDLNTVQHAWEIQRDRYKDLKQNKGNATLPKEWYWTADFSMYTMENGNATLHLGDRKHNLILQNLDDAVSQLREKNNYFPQTSDIGAVVKAKSTLSMNISDLKLKKLDNEWSYFEIKTNDYSGLNATQRAFAERVHGKGKAFERTMKMLSDNHITATTIYTLNPEYVKKQLSANNSQGLARGSFLSSFINSSYFIAEDGGVGNYSGRLRGVPLVAEGDAKKIDVPKIDEYDNALKLLTDNPNEALTRIQKNPAYASRLNALIGSYLNSKA